MSKDKELEIKLHFLEEAQDYLNTIEKVLLGLDKSHLSQQMDASLRAAHSIKGGAAMMGFDQLSQVAHRLEDFFKVLKAEKQALDRTVESQLLKAVDCLRKIIACYLQGKAISEKWLATQVNPILDSLHQRLGDPKTEDLIAQVPEAGEDMVKMLFESEVEGCLHRLEAILADPAKPCLLEECSILAQELGGLGEMLDLKAFSSLCQSIYEQLENHPEQVEEIANQALKLWRRSQALILVGQVDNLPNKLELTAAPKQPSSTQTVGSLDDTFNQPPSPPLPTGEDLLLDWDSIADEVSFNISDALLESFPLEINLEQQLQTLPEILDEELTPQLIQTLIAPPQESPSIPSKIDFQPDAASVQQDKPENTVRVSVKQLDRLNDLFGELIIDRNSLDLRLQRLRNLVGLLSRRIQTLEKSNLQLRNAYDTVASSTSFVSVAPALASLDNSTSILPGFDILEMDRYNNLHLLSQEVMETIVQIQEVRTDIELNLEETNQTARAINRSAKQLQGNINQLRMRPLADVTGRFPRALRDMCLQHQKDVDLKIYGSTTLIDRTILEALSDPLMHLLRNAFDHGIEPAEIRKAAGKPERGAIEIRAAYRGNQTLITISDDGGGIDMTKICEKAKQLGLDNADLEAATEKQLLELIFEPGFSTAEQVTSLSGRGVGMDVVRTNLQDVRGEIKVDTKLGVGTTFTISVPFTLSVMRVLLVESNGMLMALPKDAIEEMLLLKPELVLTTGGNTVLDWEETLVPLMYLNQWLEFNCPRRIVSAEDTPAIAEPTVLMVSQGNEIIGIAIDRCWGEQEVTIRQVEGSIPMPNGLTGCAVLGDGRVAPLVNVTELLQSLLNSEDSFSQPSHLETWEKTNTQPLEPTTTPQKQSILIVDDSINVRRYLALTLEKAGYQVEQAKDGQDALEKLLGGLKVNGVICDIEMPRLDGYGFLGRVKTNPAFTELPIAMLTSRSGEKHRRLAMDLGATAYFSKPYKEQELLHNLKQLILN